MAVATSKKVRERNDALGLGVGLAVAGVVGALVVLRIVKDLGEVSAAAKRPKQPWDV